MKVRFLLLLSVLFVSIVAGCKKDPTIEGGNDGGSDGNGGGEVYQDIDPVALSAILVANSNGNVIQVDYANGSTLFFKLIGINEAEVVNCQTNFVYQGNIIVPSKVEYLNRTYTVNSIGDYAFYKCDRLRSIRFPSTIISIGKAAFRECQLLKSLDFPNSLIEIHDEAFYLCTELLSVKFGNSLKTRL